ncbi:hypothetical protein B0H14DRAFT_3437317 [Mycena olivaceomarginata]|nr:hypothetical protein B0H14DRAFT_3437317 [Mycena olivaceomarginata]
MSEIPPGGLDGSTVQRLPLAARRGGATAKASRSHITQAPPPSSIPTRGGGSSSGSSRQPTPAFSRRGRGARIGSTYHLDDNGSGLSTQPQNLNQTESSGPLVAESSIPASPTLEPPTFDPPCRISGTRQTKINGAGFISTLIGPTGSRNVDKLAEVLILDDGVMMDCHYLDGFERWEDDSQDLISAPISAAKSAEALTVRVTTSRLPLLV